MPPRLGCSPLIGGVRILQEYRLYFLSAAGHILRAVDLMCADDGEAIERSQDLRGGAAAELWQLGRAVCAFPSEDGA